MKPHISVDEAMKIAEVFAKSGHFESNVYSIATRILAGVPRGLSAFDSVQSVHVIKGKISASANLIARLIKGNPLYNYRVTHSSNESCTIEFFERETPDGAYESVGTFTFTADDARRAGVKNMDRFPEQMLFSRCITSGGRMHTPAALDGCNYTLEELGEENGGDEGEVVGSNTPATTSEPTPYQERQDLMAQIKKARADHGLSVEDLREIAKASSLPLKSSDMSIPELRTFVKLLQANAVEGEDTVAEEPTMESLVLASRQAAFEDDDYD